MTITCPRCSLAFETQATTNTRCRRCKTVVRIGFGPGRPQRVAGPPEAGDATGALASPPAGGGLVAVALVVLLASMVIPPILRAIRSRRDKTEDAARTDRTQPFAPRNPMDEGTGGGDH